MAKPSRKKKPLITEKKNTPLLTERNKPIITRPRFNPELKRPFNKPTVITSPEKKPLITKTDPLIGTERKKPIFKDTRQELQEQLATPGGRSEENIFHSHGGTEFQKSMKYLDFNKPFLKRLEVKQNHFDAMATALLKGAEGTEMNKQQSLEQVSSVIHEHLSTREASEKTVLKKKQNFMKKMGVLADALPKMPANQRREVLERLRKVMNPW
jgi:flagellar biosynthesis chaperone FliJ